MHFTREINRLTTALLILLGIVALVATYWAVVGPDTILLRQDNPRLVQAESQIHRGDIVDRNGTLLATSNINSDGSFTRQYLYPEMNSALGYASIRYGVGGAEAAFNSHYGVIIGAKIFSHSSPMVYCTVSNTVPISASHSI